MSLIDEVAPDLSGVEQLRALMQSDRQPAIGQTLQFSLVEIEEGRAVFEGQPAAHALNPIGTIHGGYAAALLDSACGCTVHSRLRADQGFTTLELKVAYHKAMTDKTGRVRAEGRLVSLGRRVAFAEGTLKDDNGALYATATSTLLVFDR
jgi:uncharacterized protein (TIGR00369 family)